MREIVDRLRDLATALEKHSNFQIDSPALLREAADDLYRHHGSDWFGKDYTCEEAEAWRKAEIAELKQRIARHVATIRRVRAAIKKVEALGSGGGQGRG